MFKLAMVALGIILVSLTGLLWAVAEGPLRDPQDALRDFYEAHERAEDQLKDPLILNGHRVVPLVLAELPNKQMRLRRYVIRFLGDGRYPEALPVLEQILADESELFYFRADALESIFAISAARAQALAPAHVKGESLLGDIAEEIVKGHRVTDSRRTYWQALMHSHD